MKEPHLEIKQRVENIRDKKETIVSFELKEIVRHFDTNIEAIRKQFDIANELEKDGKKEQAEYLWRAQIVFSVSALDFYMHEITKYGICQMFNKSWEKTPHYHKIKITMKNMEMALKNIESPWLIECINDSFSSYAFGSYQNISDQLKIIGISARCVYNQAFPPTDNAGNCESNNIIDSIWKRRNKIAHQSDRQHENAEIQTIDGDYTKKCIDSIETFVHTINNAAEIKDKK